MEKEEVKEVLNEEVRGFKEKKKKPLVTSRLLFISALDKIYLVILLFSFVMLTWENFSGDISSMYYDFWARVRGEIAIIILMIIYYFILNWFYKCAAKTMLCLTENEVYKEEYVPFKRSETSIPLNKITGVSTFNVFWIFRFLIIHQYGKLPIVFPTWTNQEFKDKLNELITTDKEKIENEYENRNIISKNNLKNLKFLGLALAVIIALVGIVRLFSFFFGSETKIIGTYTYAGDDIVLNDDGTCEIDDITDETVTYCTWTYHEEDSEIYVYYEYSDYSYYYGYYTDDDTLYLEYNSGSKSLVYDGDIYRK